MSNIQKIFDTLEKFIKQRPQLGFENYCGNLYYYNKDCREVAKDRRKALQLLGVARTRNNLEALLSAFKHAYSGRLSWNANSQQIEYIAGQNYSTEYRSAVVYVLEFFLRLTEGSDE